MMSPKTHLPSPLMAVAMAATTTIFLLLLADNDPTCADARLVPMMYSSSHIIKEKIRES
jgi:hypothetical protein